MTEEPTTNVEEGESLRPTRQRRVSFEDGRTFLERNRIFFETVAALSLSIMALILSVAHIVIAVKESRLSEIRTEIERQRISPQFVISTRTRRDPAKSDSTTEEIVVTNQGGLIWNFRCRTLMVLTVQYWREHESGTGTLPEITIPDYHRSHEYSNQTSGKLVRISSEDSPTQINHKILTFS